MISIAAKDLCLSFGVDEVFGGVSFALNEGDRAGLVGANGAGKTSLLKIIAKKLAQSSGRVDIASGRRADYLSQLSDYTSQKTVWEDAISIYEDVFRIERRMRSLEEKMAQAPDDSVFSEYEKATASFEQAGGYAAERNVRSVLAGLGITQDMHKRPVDTLSGGQRARVALARIIISAPDILLLDEPTNHLDLDAIRWLENYLSSYRGTVIVVSHDRYFLDKVCSQMLELSMGTMTVYQGNYTSYLEKREEIYRQRLREYQLNQKLIKREQAIILRYRSWSKDWSYKAAKSREKRLEKIERVDKPRTEQTIAFRFDIAQTSGNDVLRCENLGMKFGEKRIFKDISLHIEKGEKIALTGPNGIGKTTLLRIFAGQLKATEGAFLPGVGVKMGYYDQHQQNLSEDKTVMDEIWDAYPRLQPQQVRDTLALFLFRGDDIEKPVSVLSGGERSRLSLLKLMLSKANLLLLDEPTNHLDIDSRQVLEDAIADFPGTVLFVSHDRYLINMTATRVLDMDENGIYSYEGNWDDYQYHLSLRRGDEEPAAAGKTERSQRFKQEREQQQRLQAEREKIAGVEREIERHENRVAEIARLFEDPARLSPQQLEELGREHRDIEKELARLLEEWTEMMS